jgi:hypothetical protein
MAKFTSLSDLGSSYLTQSTFNTNNQRIEDALTNTLSRDGSSPNSMLANLDMNDFVIENVGDAVAATDAVNKGQLDAAVLSGITDGDKGDIVVSGSGSVLTIDTGVVTFAKMQDIATDKLLGRVSASTGDVEEVTCTDFAQSLLCSYGCHVHKSQC